MTNKSKQIQKEKKTEIDEGKIEEKEEKEWTIFGKLISPKSGIPRKIV